MKSVVFDQTINYWADLWVRALKQCVGWVQNLPDDETDDGMNNECEWGSCGQWKEKKDDLWLKLLLQKMFLYIYVASKRDENWDGSFALV